MMTLEERRQLLHIICDLEETYKLKEVYKAYLEATAITQLPPEKNWVETCERMAAERSARQERMAAIFLPHYTFATEGLDTKTAQYLLDSVREEREERQRLSTQ
jgi:hypothetical protein